MPRIRTIKPEFWSSPSTAKASLIARLAYIAMWNWADDSGRGTLNFKELEGFIFPNDDLQELAKELPTRSEGTSYTFRDTVKEVVDVFGVEVYTVQGRRYYAIPGWATHQRTERKAKSKFPGPEMADNLGSEGSSDIFRRTVKEVPPHSEGSSGTGTGEQGNRGTGGGGTGDSHSTGDVTHPTPTPSPGSFLDALATAHANSMLCERHQGMNPDDVPPCRACQARREQAETGRTEAEQKAREQRKAAIDACPDCDDNGWVLLKGTNSATRCTHKNTPSSPADAPKPPNLTPSTKTKKQPVKRAYNAPF